MTTPTDTSSLIKRLIRDYIRSHRRTIGLATLCMVVVAGAAAVNAWLMQPVLDDIFLNKNKAMLLVIPAVIVAVAVLAGLANYGQTVLMRKVGQRIIAEMQMDLFSHLVRGDLDLFHDQSSGRLISRFTNDIQMMRNAVSSVLTGLAKELLAMVFLLGVMVWQSWEMSLAALILFPLVVQPVLRLGRRMRKISDGTQEEISRFAGQLDETFQAAEAVKAYGREGYEIDRARTRVETLYRLYMKASRVQAIASPMIEMVASLAIAGVIAYGGLQVIEGETTPGAFFSFMVAMIMAYKPIRAIAGLNTQLQEGLAAARRFFAVLDTAPKVVEAADAVALVVDGGSIRFEHVDFSYELSSPLNQNKLVIPEAGFPRERSERVEKRAIRDPGPQVKSLWIPDLTTATESRILSSCNVRDDKMLNDGSQASCVLSNITLNVPAGKMAALVGPSGAGKSTLMRLLMRFYNVTSGRITIDEQDIAGVGFASLRGAMAFVSQEVMLFDDSVLANIAYGREGASEDEVIAAAKGADAHGFIEQLPQGYATRIGPSGMKLSGGQRQRLSIARAMLKNAPILLLDEATSSLDSTSEQSVKHALDELMVHRTTLVIAHRLSTVQHADIIYVLEQGCIVASGTHTELLAGDGLYQRLYEGQFRG